MRVAIDGLLLWGHYSGVERAIARLSAALPTVDRENEYTIYLPADGDASALEAAGLQVRRAPFPGDHKGKRILWQQAFFPGVLRRDGTDLLLAPGYVLPLRWRGPSVLIVYDLIALTHPRLARRSNVLHYRAVLPPAARRATRIAVPATPVRDQLVTRCRVNSEKIAVIPLGVESCFRPVTDAATRAVVRERYHLPDRFLLYVGNLEPKKNLPALLEAFALLKRGGAPQHLVLAGKPGWGMAELEAALAHSGVADAIHRIGFVADADLPALYSLAELFVFPSQVEGFGLPPLEAMACGTPALVGDVPPFPETVGDAALRVDPNDPGAIAAGISRALTDVPLRERLRREGQQRAAHFTWENAARALSTLIRQAAEAK